MGNFLQIGLKIRRADGTLERYYDCDYDEIKNHEISYHSIRPFEVVAKVYAIENEFHEYEFVEELGLFRDFNEPADEITEIETAHGIAHYIWTQALDADEDSAHAFKCMAVDIFGSFEKWRAMAFWHMMLEFEHDVDYLKEVTR